MKVVCTLRITDENISNLVNSVNPENNPKEAKGPQTIISSFEDNSVVYHFNNFEKISTLRLTLEDLLNHLAFSNEINDKIKKRAKKSKF